MRPTSARLMTACPVLRVDDLAVHDVERVGRRLGDRAGERENVLP